MGYGPSVLKFILEGVTHPHDVPCLRVKSACNKSFVFDRFSEHGL